MSLQGNTCSEIYHFSFKVSLYDMTALGFYDFMNAGE